ncbi:hypothetical protein JX265_003869 [Neoarthrinium moseri]|uniref:Uncharacterized protein n=1 Tax=Neoarthrinium moseri TaxID=1658444 RepID=A0A9P9WRA3_9PEZI|nr:hypothetical protein JX266_001781 [Neoarthrinium moseri]KAI1876343.1 hypothetical protein JX265_003869 [Neoarthrinium moseri]
MAKSQKQSVLITGCSEGGIGFALAQEFHRRGLRVFATARNLGKVQHLRDAGLEVIQLDVVDPASIRSAVENVSQLTGGALDILVNNAGNGYQIPILDADLAEARRLFEVNLFGVLAMTQAFAPLLVAAATKGSKPRIVNIGSVVSRVPVPWGGVYNASKGALAILNDTMRLELRALGIEVLHVVTGGIATKFYTNSGGQKLPEGSLYSPIASHIEANVGGGEAKAKQTVTAETYARKVVGNALSSRPTTTMWIGGMSFISWFGIKFGWDSVRDLIITRMFSMASLEKKLKESRQLPKA